MAAQSQSSLSTGLLKLCTVSTHDLSLSTSTNLVVLGIALDEPVSRGMPVPEYHAVI